VIERWNSWCEQQFVQQAEVDDASKAEREFAQSIEPHEFTVAVEGRSALARSGSPTPLRIRARFLQTLSYSCRLL
jgi:hypothetical protein